MADLIACSSLLWWWTVWPLCYQDRTRDDKFGLPQGESWRLCNFLHYPCNFCLEVAFKPSSSLCDSSKKMQCNKPCLVMLLSPWEPSVKTCTQSWKGWIFYPPSTPPWGHQSHLVFLLPRLHFDKRLVITLIYGHPAGNFPPWPFCFEQVGVYSQGHACHGGLWVLLGRVVPPLKYNKCHQFFPCQMISISTISTRQILSCLLHSRNGLVAFGHSGANGGWARLLRALGTSSVDSVSDLWPRFQIASYGVGGSVIRSVAVDVILTWESFWPRQPLSFSHCVASWQ